MTVSQILELANGFAEHMYESMLDTLFIEELYIKKFKSLQNEAKTAEK